MIIGRMTKWLQTPSPSNTALVSEACAAALRAFYSAPHRER
jgi:hypothetical protein